MADVVSTEQVSALQPQPRRMRIRRFSVVQTANLAAIVYLVLFAIFLVPIGLIGGIAGGAVGGGNYSAIFLIFVPILYAIFGWIFVALACLLYNLVAGWVGGVEFTLEDAPIAAQ
ncbi:MAG TPA: hypothetical protein VFG86_20560 [Chloroflexota bacterium]|nr:hypothetical protein [Chloroflexota bacterium]